jgi:hypothetical protein
MPDIGTATYMGFYSMEGEGGVVVVYCRELATVGV